jgi:hypothetical protein
MVTLPVCLVCSKTNRLSYPSRLSSLSGLFYHLLSASFVLTYSPRLPQVLNGVAEKALGESKRACGIALNGEQSSRVGSMSPLVQDRLCGGRRANQPRLVGITPGTHIHTHTHTYTHTRTLTHTLTHSHTYTLTHTHTHTHTHTQAPPWLSPLPPASLWPRATHPSRLACVL